MFLLIPYCVMFSCVSFCFAGGFLEKSKLLKELNITIVPAEVIDGNVLIQQDESKKSVDKYFLCGNDSPQLLITDKNPKKKSVLDWGCGESVQAEVLKFKDDKFTSGNFVAVGKNAAKHIKWLDSEKLYSASPGCVQHNKAGFVINHIDIFRVKSIDDFLIWKGVWDSPAKKKLEESQLLLHTQKISPEEFKKVSEKAYNSQEFQHEIYGTFDRKGICVKLGEIDINQEGTSGRVDNLLGAIEIRSGEKKELWLVFSAAGYEGQAYYAVLFNPSAESGMITDFYVYTGC